MSRLSHRKATHSSEHRQKWQCKYQKTVYLIDLELHVLMWQTTVHQSQSLPSNSDQSNTTESFIIIIIIIIWLSIDSLVNVKGRKKMKTHTQDQFQHHSYKYMPSPHTHTHPFTHRYLHVRNAEPTECSRSPSNTWTTRYFVLQVCPSMKPPLELEVPPGTEPGLLPWLSAFQSPLSLWRTCTTEDWPLV